MRISKLTLLIDNSTHQLAYPFTYQPDPIITQIEPSESFLSGGRLILITGHHFASPQTTKLMLYHESKHNIINGTSCITQNDTLITCLTPAISRELATTLLTASGGQQLSDTGDRTGDTQPSGAYFDGPQLAPTGTSPQPSGASQNHNLLAYEEGGGLKLKMMFIMDDVKSVRNLDEYYHHLPHFMSYFEDPQLFRLPLQVIDYVETLIIAGENLNMKQLDQDMLITIGVHICPIKSILINQVICEPATNIAPVYDDNGQLVDKPLLPIVGLIGSNLRFQIGHMQYSSKQYQQQQTSSSSSSSLGFSLFNSIQGQQQARPPLVAGGGQSDYSTAAATTSSSHYNGTNSNSATLIVWTLLSVLGFLLAFGTTFFFAIAKFRQSKAEREYKRIQLQMGSLDMNGPAGSAGSGQSNGLFYNKINLTNGASFFQTQNHQSDQSNNFSFRSRALNYVGGAFSGVSSSTGKSKPLYQFSNQQQQQQQQAPPLPSFPPSPLTDISSLLGSGASPAHLNHHHQQQQQQQHQQHLVKLNLDGSVVSSTSNANHQYPLYGVGNMIGAPSSSSSSSPGQNMFSVIGAGGQASQQLQASGNSKNFSWNQEAPSTIVPYAVIEACNLTLEGKNAIKEYV